MIRVTEMIRWVRDHPVRAGALAGWFQQAAGAGIGILLVPALSKLLPAAECGLWFAFQGTVAVAGLADLGLGFAISRQAAFCLGQREGTLPQGDFLDFGAGGAGLAGLNAHSVVLYRVLAVLAAAGGAVLYDWIAAYTRMMEGTRGDMRGVFYLMLVVPVCMLLANRANSLMVGTGNMFAARAGSGMFMLCQGGSVLAAAMLTKSLWWMAVCSAAMALVYLAVTLVISRRVVPGLADGHAPAVDRGVLWRLCKIAGPVGLVNIGGYLVNAVQVPALGAMLGPTLVAPFYLAQRIGMFLTNAALQTHHSRLPMFTKLHANGDHVSARALMNRSLKTSTLCLIGAALVFVCFSPALALLFGKTLSLPRSVMGMMALDYVFMGCAVIWAHFIMAAGKNPFTITTLLNGGWNLVFLSLLVPKLGIIGIPLASICAGVLSNYGYIAFRAFQFRKVMSGHVASQA